MADERMSWRAVWVGPELGLVVDAEGRRVPVDEPGWHIVSDGDGPAGYPVVLRLDGVTHADDPTVAEWVAAKLSASAGGGLRVADVLDAAWFGSATRDMVVVAFASALGVPDPDSAFYRRDDRRMRVVWTR